MTLINEYLHMNTKLAVLFTETSYREACTGSSLSLYYVGKPLLVHSGFMTYNGHKLFKNKNVVLNTTNAMQMTGSFRLVINEKETFLTICTIVHKFSLTNFLQTYYLSKVFTLGAIFFLLPFISKNMIQMIILIPGSTFL